MDNKLMEYIQNKYGGKLLDYHENQLENIVMCMYKIGSKVCIANITIDKYKGIVEGK